MHAIGVAEGECGCVLFPDDVSIVLYATRQEDEGMLAFCDLARRVLVSQALCRKVDMLFGCCFVLV